MCRITLRQSDLRDSCNQRFDVGSHDHLHTADACHLFQVLECEAALLPAIAQRLDGHIQSDAITELVKSCKVRVGPTQAIDFAALHRTTWQ